MTHRQSGRPRTPCPQGLRSRTDHDRWEPAWVPVRLRSVTDRRLVFLSMLGILLTACSSSSPRESPSGAEVKPACCPLPLDAKVSGVLVGIGGPVRTAARHWEGTIHARGSLLTRTFRTDGRGHFVARLAAGTYRFTATSPSYDDGNGRVPCPGTRPVALAPRHPRTRGLPVEVVVPSPVEPAD